MNQLQIFLKSQDVNGRPQIKVKVGDVVAVDQTLKTDLDIIKLNLSTETSIQLERYGKTFDNTTELADQTLAIEKITIDGVRLPDYILYKNSKFEFNNQCDIGGLVFVPNGIWTFEFKSPFITWVLDQKILHESQWNQDYQYPWAFKLGPDSVNIIRRDLDQARQRVNQVL